MIENELPTRLVRHSAPNKFDQAPLGTECVVMKENGKIDLYIQKSSDENNPEWMFMDSIEHES